MIVIDNPHFEDGWQAYTQHLPREANPFLYMANPHRLWLLGWDCARLCELATLGIHQLPEDITADEAGLRRLDKSPFTQGQVAYAKGIAIDDCPYGPGSEDAINWRAGWRFDARRKAKPKPEPVSGWLGRMVPWLFGP